MHIPYYFVVKLWMMQTPAAAAQCHSSVEALQVVARIRAPAIQSPAGHRFDKQGLKPSNRESKTFCKSIAFTRRPSPPALRRTPCWKPGHAYFA